MTAQPKPKATRHALVFLAVVLALIAMVSAASAVSQTWCLSTDDSGYDYPGSNAVREMHLDASGTTGSVTVDSSGRLWIPDDPAAPGGVTFPANSVWSFSARQTVSIGGDSVTVTIGVYNPAGGGSFTPWNSITVTITTTSPASPWTITVTDSKNIAEGSYLALFLDDVGGFGDTYIDTANCVSYLQSPSSDPGYPYPELSTFLLMSVGLLALVGYVGYRKRKGT